MKVKEYYNEKPGNIYLVNRESNIYWKIIPGQCCIQVDLFEMDYAVRMMSCTFPYRFLKIRYSTRKKFLEVYSLASEQMAYYATKIEVSD